MTLAPYIRIVARGKGRARSLTKPEATEAMGLILSGKADPEAIGALLMVLRLRGETDAEIAGFTCALRALRVNLAPADLDWPCYGAGRTRGAPLFLLSAKLVAQAGYRVVLHGWNAHQRTTADPRKALHHLGLEGGGLSYLALESLSPVAFDLLKLRDVLGLRSCMNTILRMWNPAGAQASVQGVFHPSYRGLQTRAARLLGDQTITVIKGGGGEFERHPAKATPLFGLRGNTELNEQLPAMLNETRRLHDPNQPVDLGALWYGSQVDPFAQATVIGTAALALWTVGAAKSVPQATIMAGELWQDRQPQNRKSA